MFIFQWILLARGIFQSTSEVILTDSTHPRYIPAQPVNQQLMIVLLLRLRVGLGEDNRLYRASVVHYESNQAAYLNEHVIRDRFQLMVHDCRSIWNLCAPIVNFFECLVV
jgi:hypothetical protein